METSIAGLLGQRYEATGRTLGSGGMGRVLEAVDKALDRPVAIKILDPVLAADPAVCRRFNREAIAAAALNHPHVVSVYDVCIDHVPPFIVMEQLPGQTMADEIAKGPMEAATVQRLGLDMLSALDHAHSLGIIHRDIKPGNLLLDKAGSVKVADFGIAKSLNQDSTRTDGLFGTPCYLAPELLRGEPASPQTDVYAAGVTLYEMLTGTKPFSSDTPWATLAKIQRGERPHLRELIPNVDPLLEEVIETAMDASPQRRYKSAGDMAAVLASKPITNRQSKARVVDLDRLGVSDPTRLMEPAASNETVLMGTPARVEAPPSPWASRSGVLRNPMVLLAGLAAVVLIVLGVFAMADGGGSVPVNNPEPVAERQVAPSEDISDQELRDALDTLRSAVRL